MVARALRWLVRRDKESDDPVADALHRADADPADPDGPAVRPPTPDQGQPPSADDRPPSDRDQLPSGRDRLPSGRDQPPSGRDQLPSAHDRLPSAHDRLPSGRGQDSDRSSLRRGQDRDQPPSRRGAAGSSLPEAPEVAAGPEPPAAPGELVVAEPSIRYAYPDVPPILQTSTRPATAATGAIPVPRDGSAAELVRERQLVRQAVSFVDDQERLIRDFYALLFALGGAEVVAMFPSDLRRQRQEFGRALVQWVTADDPDALAGHLDQLGADHRKFDVEPAHYALAGEALVAAVRGRSGGLLTSEHETALRGSYHRLAALMVKGALDRISEPAHWDAEIVGHHRHTDDFAVVTLQPSAPYAYRAGQYTTVELDRRPKLWRQMSIASAPRANNTFDLHVRALPGGDVSGALVRHAQVGDRLRIGPPRGGALVVEQGTTDALLCLAAGAGAAPISAVVESVLRWRTPPTLYAYVGARTAQDLYPVHHLASRTSGMPQVHIRGIVSDEPGFPGLRGRVESVAPGLAPWATLGVEVLVAGPTRMMDQTVTNLRQVGVPTERIHFDQYEAE